MTYDIRLWSDPYSVALEHGHCCVVVRSAHDDPLVGVGLLYDSAVMHYWLLPYQTNSSGDGLLLPQRRVVRRWWRNNQLPLHSTVTEFHPIFTNVFTNSAGLNKLLNTHHTDIIITHHSSYPQWRVLIIITMLDTNITIMSTNELTQVVHRSHNKGSAPYRLT
jgi:hypothetical protein